MLTQCTQVVMMLTSKNERINFDICAVLRVNRTFVLLKVCVVNNRVAHSGGTFEYVNPCNLWSYTVLSIDNAVPECAVPFAIYLRTAQVSRTLRVLAALGATR